MDDMRKELFYEQKNGYELIDAQERLALEDYCREYMDFLNSSRTEREAELRRQEVTVQQQALEAEINKKADADRYAIEQFTEIFVPCAFARR